MLYRQFWMRFRVSLLWGGNADVVYTIQDESGIVYVYDLKNRRMDHEIPFAGKGDFEDIANDGKQLYVLKSNGAVYSLPIDKNIVLTQQKYMKVYFRKVSMSLWLTIQC